MTKRKEGSIRTEADRIVWRAYRGLLKLTPTNKNDMRYVSRMRVRLFWLAREVIDSMKPAPSGKQEKTEE